MTPNPTAPGGSSCRHLYNYPRQSAFRFVPDGQRRCRSSVARRQRGGAYPRGGTGDRWLPKPAAQPVRPRLLRPQNPGCHLGNRFQPDASQLNRAPTNPRSQPRNSPVRSHAPRPANSAIKIEVARINRAEPVSISVPPGRRQKASGEVILALRWGDWGSNPGLTDYESAALTN